MQRANRETAKPNLWPLMASLTLSPSLFLFMLDSPTTTAIESSILTALRLGKSKIRGRCVGISPVNGQQIVYSADEVEINVVPFDKVKIATPLTRIRTGAVMPATIWGVPNISPMILGEFRV